MNEKLNVYVKSERRQSYLSDWPILHEKYFGKAINFYF